jgi:hypothetical protein
MLSQARVDSGFKIKPQLTLMLPLIGGGDGS